MHIIATSRLRMSVFLSCNFNSRNTENEKNLHALHTDHSFVLRWPGREETNFCKELMGEVEIV